jgi:hypothetical protein
VKPVLSLPAVLIAGPAAAHPGHIADLAGHNHWLAGAAIGAAIAAAIWGHLKGKKDAPEEEHTEEDTPEEQSA